jgi:predicted membrane protein
VKKSNRGMFGGMLLLVVGTVWLFNNFGVFRFDFGDFIGQAWPLIIIFVGVYLLFGAKVMAPIASVAGTGTIKQAVGEMDLTPESIGPDGLLIALSAGEVRLDLRDARLQDGENLVEVKLGAGDVRIKTPLGIPLSIEGTTGVGDLHLLGRDVDGFVAKLNHEDDDYKQAGKKLRIIAKAGLGDVRVTRG